MRCDSQGAVRGQRLSLLRSRSTTCALSPGSSATTGFYRRSEDLEAGGPPADSFPPVGSYSLRNAGRRETEDRPAALRSCPCVHVSTCGYCLSGAVAANRVVRTGPGCVGCARWSVANRSVVHPTRLGTRTKESNMCASHWVLRNLKA